jgi:hypothetical protein
MDSYGRIEVTDSSGWCKEFPLAKGLVHIGSDPRNDVILGAGRGAGVAPRHLQVVPGQGAGYRVINLSDADILLDAPSSPSGGVVLPSRSVMDVADGDRLQLGDFSLVFHLGAHSSGARAVPVSRQRALAGTAAEETSDVIGLSLSLPRTSLDLDRDIEGTVIVHNLGDRPGVQFKLELEGLTPDCYEIGPGPILFPNAAKEVFLRLHHSRKPEPPAGDHRILIRATAPEAYPGQRAVVSEVIHVPPFYSHQLRFVVPGGHEQFR